METIIITSKILNQPPNFVLPQLFVIEEIGTITTSNVDLLSEYFFCTTSNLIAISKDCMVLGFFDRDEVNIVPNAKLLSIMLIIVINHTILCYDTKSLVF